MDEPVGRPERLPVITTGVHGAHDLARVRRLLADTCADIDLPADRIELFTIALSEVATNAVLHGNGSATVTITGGDTALTVEVRDRGTGLATRPRPARPDPAQINGRGLWLAEQLCDQVDITSSASGTTVRLTMRLKTTPPHPA